MSEIPNLTSDKSNIISNVTFYFKKMNGKCLMLMVEYYFLTKRVVYQPKFPDGVVLNDIHYKYNFIVQPFVLERSVHLIKNPGAKLFLMYPEKINLASSNSSIIRFIMNNSSLIEGIKLNLDCKSDLECEDLNRMKKCIVPKSHFYMKRSGYFNSYHKRYTEKYFVIYDASLINITLPEKEDAELYIEYEDNKNTKKIGYQGFLNFVINYDDNKNNIT